ncbi:DUF192 domain-containing protein [Pseudovibrio sp. SPO723]|uniref:DUF192 domain-containing protein n=1 Tax=Nesiotobacter zosterae TaxID=392721 RepID=UPI0029C5B74C|nr:DUF192 domain-containing protein [Pseudovibrio sp. SPO723]MDX5592837.1 DUF192 domain-containing protein [Pseudovibrio sp. SPO723]
MIRSILGSFGILVALWATLFSSWASEVKVRELDLVTARGTHAFTVELAETPEARGKGLMYRKSLPENHGMLFIFERTRDQLFWMKNTPLPLDIIFLTDDWRVHHVHENAEPFSESVISSRGPVRYVVEFEAGMATRTGLSRGDQFRLGVEVFEVPTR